MTGVVLTVVGTLAAVIAAVVAVLQLRRTPVLPRRDVARSSGNAGVPVAPEAEASESPVISARPKRKRAPSGPGTRVGGRAVAQPVPLHPPTGRLEEVRGRVELLSRLAVLCRNQGTGRRPAMIAAATSQPKVVKNAPVSYCPAA